MKGALGALVHARLRILRRTGYRAGRDALMSSASSSEAGIKRLVIGVGEMAVSDDAAATLSTYGLGSCVGVVAYDPKIRAGGILHLMLPNSAIAPERSRGQPAMFADTGLPRFVDALIQLRADRTRLRFFLVGGASVIALGSAYRIGAKNLEAASAWLTSQGFQIADVGTGGNINRTLHLELGTGAMTLRTPHSHETFSFLSLSPAGASFAGAVGPN